MLLYSIGPDELHKEDYLFFLSLAVWILSVPPLEGPSLEAECVFLLSRNWKMFFCWSENQILD